jgi:hypothetical protein
MYFSSDMDMKKGCGDKDEFCKYCARKVFDTKKQQWTDDKGNKIDQTKYPTDQDCNTLQNEYMFDAQMGSTLTFESSVFNQFRQGMKAIIYSVGGNIVIKDTVFVNSIM